MRENRPYGSEGGEAKSLPYPYQLAMQDLLERAVLPDRAPLDETGPPRSRGRVRPCFCVCQGGESPPDVKSYHI